MGIGVCQNHSLHQGISEFLPVLSIFIIRLGESLHHRSVHNAAEHMQVLLWKSAKENMTLFL